VLKAVLLFEIVINFGHRRLSLVMGQVKIVLPLSSHLLVLMAACKDKVIRFNN
jgi:hypothetical protein